MRLLCVRRKNIFAKFLLPSFCIAFHSKVLKVLSCCLWALSIESDYKKSIFTFLQYFWFLKSEGDETLLCIHANCRSRWTAKALTRFSNYELKNFQRGIVENELKAYITRISHHSSKLLKLGSIHCKHFSA